MENKNKNPFIAHVNQSQKYQESINKIPEPIMSSQLPKIKIDLAGMSHYAKEKGVSLNDLSAKEKKKFIP